MATERAGPTHPEKSAFSRGFWLGLISATLPSDAQCLRTLRDMSGSQMMLAVLMVSMDTRTHTGSHPLTKESHVQRHHGEKVSVPLPVHIFASKDASQHEVSVFVRQRLTTCSLHPWKFIIVWQTGVYTHNTYK